MDSVVIGVDLMFLLNSVNVYVMIFVKEYYEYFCFF